MTANQQSSDLLVIGGGPAGVAAALHGSDLGAEATLIERGRVGGTALNSGPAPVRTLARAARLVRDWSSWETFGLRGPRPTVDLAATLANAKRVADYAYERRRAADHIRSAGVVLIEEAGAVRFRDANTVTAADGREWHAGRVIIAVGGRASRLPIPGAELALTYEDVRTVTAADGREWHAGRVIIAVGGRASRLPIPGAELALTYEDVRTLTALPDRVCVIGAADTGCQLASILADFGCQVWLLEYAPRIVPRADEDVSAELEQAFRARDIRVVTGAAVERLEPLQSGVRIVYRAHGERGSVEVGAAFFAVGWPSNADLLDVAAAGVTMERGYVVVDEYLRTNVPHIFAAGDVDGRSMLVSSALLEGRVAAENAVLGAGRRIDNEIVPTGSFTDPEYASVGLTETQARERYSCAVAVARYEDLLRPVADGQPEGFCKLIVEMERRQIVGAHVLGEYSAEVIQMVATCMAGGMPIEDVAELQFAFPTFTEGVGMAAQMLVRDLGVRAMPQVWSSLSARPVPVIT